MRGLLRIQREVDCSTDPHTGRLSWCCRRNDYVEILPHYQRCLHGCKNHHGSSALSPRFCVPYFRGLELHNSRSCDPRSHSSHAGFGYPCQHPRGTRLYYRCGSRFPTPRGSSAAVGVLSLSRLGKCYSYYRTWSPATTVSAAAPVQVLVLVDISRVVRSPARTLGVLSGIPSSPSF